MSSSFDDSAGAESLQQQQEVSLLARGIRTACGLILVVSAALAGGKIVSGGARYPSIFLLELTQVVVVLAVLRWLQRKRDANNLLAIAVGIFAILYLTSAALGALAGNVTASPLIFSAFVLATGAMLPWGVQPQLITVSTAGLALLAQVFLLDVYDMSEGYQAASLGVTAVAMIASIGMVWRIETYRTQSSKAQSLWMKAERALVKMQEEIERRTGEGEALRAVNADLESFSYSVSHDLRAPLRSVRTFTDALMEDYGPQLDPNARELVERLRAAVRRMGNLIDALLDVSHVTHNELQAEQSDLGAMAREIVAELRAASPARTVAVQAGEALTANGDPRLLRVLLANLVGNAWKFTAKAPEAAIEIGRLENGGEAVFFVRDNGVGFDPQKTAEMFTPFRRFHAGFEGSGIGLSIAARVVARHGGRIWAEGRPGQGATFYFTLAAGAAGTPGNSRPN